MYIYIHSHVNDRTPCHHVAIYIYSACTCKHVLYLFWAVLNTTNGVGLFGDEFCLKFVPSSSIYQVELGKLTQPFFDYLLKTDQFTWFTWFAGDITSGINMIKTYPLPHLLSGRFWYLLTFSLDYPETSMTLNQAKHVKPCQTMSPVQGRKAWYCHHVWWQHFQDANRDRQCLSGSAYGEVFCDFWP